MDPTFHLDDMDQEMDCYKGQPRKSIKLRLLFRRFTDTAINGAPTVSYLSRAQSFYRALIEHVILIDNPARDSID